MNGVDLINDRGRHHAARTRSDPSGIDLALGLSISRPAWHAACGLPCTLDRMIHLDQAPHYSRTRSPPRSSAASQPASNSNATASCSRGLSAEASRALALSRQSAPTPHPLSAPTRQPAPSSRPWRGSSTAGSVPGDPSAFRRDLCVSLPVAEPRGRAAGRARGAAVVRPPLDDLVAGDRLAGDR